MGNLIVFIIIAAFALLGAVGTVVSRNAIYSALFLVLNMAMLAVFYVLLNAPFIAMVQVAVYAGAIMVLFVFAIMLLGAERLPGMLPNRPQVVVALVLGLVILGLLVFSLFTAPLPAGDIEAIDAGPVAVGMTLFERYVLPLEVTSILLLVAMIGVVVFRARTTQRREDA